MIVTITNQKGGCGKTTTAQALSAGLVRKGYKVLAVDADPQTNFTYASNVEKASGSLYDVLSGSKAVEGCISETACGYDIIAGSIKLTAIDSVLKGAGRESVLKRALKPIEDSFDFIVIDTPPMLGTLTANALIASDCVIIPMCADIFSIQGLSQLQGMIANAKKYNPSLYIDGLLLTKYTLRTIINRQIKKDLERIAKQLETKLYKAQIREATAVKECQLLRTDLFTEYPRANITKDFEAFVDEFLKGLKK